MKSDRLTADKRNELPDEDFGIPGSRKFPLEDAAHVRSAESYFRYAPDGEKPQLARRILRAAERFDVAVHSETILDWAKK